MRVHVIITGMKGESGDTGDTGQHQLGGGYRCARHCPCNRELTTQPSPVTQQAIPGASTMTSCQVRVQDNYPTCTTYTSTTRPPEKMTTTLPGSLHSSWMEARMEGLTRTRLLSWSYTRRGPLGASTIAVSVAL